MKIIALLNSVTSEDNTFLHFNKRLALSVKADLQLLSNYMPIHHPSLSPIVGQGLSLSGPEIFEEDIEQMEESLKELASSLSEGDFEVTYKLALEAKDEAIQRMSEDAEVLLVTIQKYNEASFWNEMFGTEETYIANNVTLPILIIPAKLKFESPTKMLYIIHNTREVKDLSKVSKIGRLLGIKIHYLINTNGYELSRDSYLKKLGQDMNLKFSSDIGQVTFYDDHEDEVIQKILDKDNSDWIGYQNSPYNGLTLGGRNIHKNHVILNVKKPLLLI